MKYEKLNEKFMRTFILPLSKGPYPCISPIQDYKAPTTDKRYYIQFNLLPRFFCCFCQVRRLASTELWQRSPLQTLLSLSEKRN